jgi:N-acetylglucosaminyldiphosphoundecaprenol N-acetyl-beta-D-mannosaminyltransferase
MFPSGMKPHAPDAREALGLPAPVPVLGTPLIPTTHNGLIASLRARVSGTPPVAVSFVNTQIVSHRRAHPEFHTATHDIDLFIPDGMPLVWCMNRMGAALDDRVFGPEFMKRALETEDGARTHYILGGTSESGARLLRRAASEWPAVRFVGAYHGRCSEDGHLGESREEEEHVLRELDTLRPDWIWIGMGEARQNALLARMRQRSDFGVWLGVGCALDMLAGLQPIPPDWMQRAGLSWVHRWAHAPGRMSGRYAKYNTLFLLQLLDEFLHPSTSPTGD